MNRTACLPLVALAALGLGTLWGCGPPATTGMGIRLLPGGGTGVHQFVVELRNEAGTLIHTCLGPTTPSPTPFEGEETWTVLLPDELSGLIDVTALGISEDGRQRTRGSANYFVGRGAWTTAAVFLTPNLSDPVLPPACTMADPDTLPPRVPLGSVATVDERGSPLVDGIDAGTDSGLAGTDAGDAGDAGL